jgi:hypothetical protein
MTGRRRIVVCGRRAQLEIKPAGEAGGVTGAEKNTRHKEKHRSS